MASHQHRAHHHTPPHTTTHHHTPPHTSTTHHHTHNLDKTETHITKRSLSDETPSPVENRDMCPQGGQMLCASPQSHYACGWGSSKMGRHGGIMQSLDSPPSPHPKWVGKSAHPSVSGVFPPQQVNQCAHPEVPTGALTQPLWHTAHTHHTQSTGGHTTTPSFHALHMGFACLIRPLLLHLPLRLHLCPHECAASPRWPIH